MIRIKINFAENDRNFCLRQLPINTPCYKKIIEQQYSEHEIRRVCELSWHVENCLNGELADEAFEHFWKPCCPHWLVQEFKCEDHFLGTKRFFFSFIYKE